MKLEIRKIVSFVDDTLIEGGRAAPRPLRMAASAVVIRNPWAGGFVEVRHKKRIESGMQWA